MFVSKGCEQTSAHGITEMDELVTSWFTEFRNGSGALDSYFSVRIHAKSFANIYELVDVGSHAVEESTGDNNCHYLSNLNSDTLRLLRRINNNLSLLISLRFHFFIQIINSLQIICIESFDKNRKQIWNTESQIVTSRKELLDQYSRQFPILLNFVIQSLEQYLLNFWQNLLINFIGSLVLLGYHEYLI